MRIQVFQQVTFEDAANVGVWAADRGHELAVTRLYAGQVPPAPSEYDWLAIMGGPMNIHEHDAHPWLAVEKRAIAAAIDAGRMIVGICLGAQLLADALGAKVTRNAHREIGWHEVRLTPAAADSVLADLPERCRAFHWHGDTFAIPDGAARLAASDACANQAFQYGDRILALQFHLDYSHASIRTMVDHCADELDGSQYVQHADELLRDDGRVAATTGYLNAILDRLAEGG